MLFYTGVDTEATLVAFDLLQFEGEDWRKLALEVRRAQLESVVSGIDGLTFSYGIAHEGAIVFAHACRLGLEGIVSKLLGGVYSSGRCRNWLKVKNPEFKRRLTGKAHPASAAAYQGREAGLLTNRPRPEHSGQEEVFSIRKRGPPEA